MMGEKEKLAPVKYSRTHKSNVISTELTFRELTGVAKPTAWMSRVYSDVTHAQLTWTALLTSRTDENRGLEVEAWRVWHVYVLGTSKFGPSLGNFEKDVTELGLGGSL